MIPKTGIYKYSIDAYFTDFRGKATLPLIGKFILQAATKHAEEREFGYSYMKENNCLWVLSRMAIEMIQYPTNDTDFIVKTWVANVNRLSTERFFTFEDGSGNVLGYAKTLWVAIDTATRRPVNILELKNMVNFLDVQQACPIQDMSKIPLIKDGYVGTSSFIVQYSDIDINKHLNSMKYIEHIIDTFNIEIFVSKYIRRFEINYLAEGHYGKQIDIQKFAKTEDEFILEMKDQETTVSSVRIVWK